MKWNWQQSDWPLWRYDTAVLEPLERQFLLGSGRLRGVWDYLSQTDREKVQIELLSSEAIKTSEIEGQMLDRDSVQSSIRRQFGMQVDRRAGPAESGMAELMVACFRDFGAPLSHESLFGWHRLVCRGRTDLREVGAYRSHPEPMQVVSGPVYRPKVHFQAPPSESVPAEMEAFINWLGAADLPALAKAALVQLYFVSIHPFEDGNGRLGRALSEKVLAQLLGQPSLLALSRQIEKKRKGYYDALADNNREMDVTGWVEWFGQTALEAQQYSNDLMDLVIAKTKLLDRLRGAINPRQQKALLRLFDAGPEGFIGGLSASNYRSITGAPAATARRDLSDLVDKGALTRTGEKRGTRYWLNTTTASS
ncbi:MAG: Fic family protein [Gammaproteobacteria bacterium]